MERRKRKAKRAILTALEPSHPATKATKRMAARDKNLVAFENARRYFEEHKAMLLQDFAGRYVAIIEDKVVDSDADFGQLATRVYKQFGYKAIYMPYVSETPTVVHIPSPHLI